MKRSLTAGCVLFFIFSLCVAVSACHAADAVVDYAEVLRHAPGYSEAVKGYNETVARQKPEFEKRLAAARTEEERTALKENYARFCKEQRRAAFAGVLPHVKDALRQIGQEKGYSAVYDKAQGKTGTDVTQEAIALVSRQKSATAETRRAVPVPAAAKPAALPPKTEAQPKKPPQPAAVVQPVRAVAPIMPAETKAQPKQPPANAEVQFGAGNSKGAIDALVERAKKNGIETAYTAEAKDKNGRTLWRARATAANPAEARELSAKLSRIGLKNFIVK